MKTSHIELKPNVVEVIPGLWLGNFLNALDQDFFIQANIDIVYNCTCNFKYAPFLQKLGIIRFRIPIKDDLTEESNKKMYNVLPDAVDQIHSALLKQKNILVHCHAGKQRSVSIIVGYLMKYGELSYYDAFKLLLTKKHDIGCMDDDSNERLLNFEVALLQFENDLEI